MSGEGIKRRGRRKRGREEGRWLTLSNVAESVTSAEKVKLVLFFLIRVSSLHVRLLEEEAARAASDSLCVQWEDI